MVTKKCHNRNFLGMWYSIKVVPVRPRFRLSRGGSAEGKAPLGTDLFPWIKMSVSRTWSFPSGQQIVKKSVWIDSMGMNRPWACKIHDSKKKIYIFKRTTTIHFWARPLFFGATHLSYTFELHIFRQNQTAPLVDHVWFFGMPMALGDDGSVNIHSSMCLHWLMLYLLYPMIYRILTIRLV